MALDALTIIDLINSDPCAAYRQLSAARLQMGIDGRPQKITFRDRDLWFQPDKGEILKEFEDRAANACAAVTGKPVHFAITMGGGRRRCRGI